jgi:formylglycine-generating enzyme required for sulfatase activity
MKGKRYAIILPIAFVVLLNVLLMKNHLFAQSTSKQVKVLKEIAANMVKLSGGWFVMGNDLGEMNEKPARRVKVEPFLINRYEVTQEQYETIMGSNPSYFKGNPKLPIECVNWSECQEFINKLNALGGKIIYRLPTGAEWEYACRAGTTTEFCFGDVVGYEVKPLGEYGWHRGNSNNKTHPVGQLKPNPWGLYDMHGNVWEWTQEEVKRGGGYNEYAAGLRSSVRVWSGPESRSTSVGFRLAGKIR